MKHREIPVTLDFMRVSAIYRFVTHKFSGQEKTPETRSFRGHSGEAQTGFEPVDTGVADHCLTTWLLRHIKLNDSNGNRTRVTAVKGRCLNRLTMEPQYLFSYEKTPRVGLEPTTTRLTAECSTIELSRNITW